MTRPRSLRRLFRLPASEDGVVTDVSQEIAFHIEERTQALIARGMDPSAARAAALREFGDVRESRAELEAIDRRSVRQLRRSIWLSDLRQDLRYGVRSLLNAPLFTLLATVTLAVGIGANAAIFGLVKSVLLDALPYTEADRLVRVYGGLRDGSQQRGPLSAGTIAAIAARQRSFESVAAFSALTVQGVYGDPGGPRVAKIGWVEPSFFRTLGVPAALGRTFHGDDATSGLAPLSGGQLASDTAGAVVITHAVWHQLFAGDPGVIGRDVRINDVSRTVIGVLPRRFVDPISDSEFYLAFDRGPVVDHPVLGWRSQWLGLVARLEPGVPYDTGRREIDALWADLVREYPAENATLAVSPMPLRDALVGDTRTPLLIILASSALVLIIACANLAGAFLSRTLTRRKEFAVRAAIGAGRGRVVRQLLTESTLLALVGGAAGLGLAAMLLGMLRGVNLSAIPSFAELSLDAGTVFGIAGLTVCTGVMFGIAPAMLIAGTNPQLALRDETRGAGESRRSGLLRGALVAGQIAVCISLLAGTGLLARSLSAMATAPLGFEPAGVLTATVQLPVRDYSTPAAFARFEEQFVQRLATLPGVESVASATSIPTRVRSRVPFSLEGAPESEAQPLVSHAGVSEHYFRTLRIPLRQGRTFDAQDGAGAPPAIVVSESMARRYWPRGDALGSRIRIGTNQNAPLLEVIGIVGDIRNDPARPDPEPMLYRSNRQNPWPIVSVLLRTIGDPLALASAMERELTALDPGLPLQQAMTLEGVIDQQLTVQRVPVVLVAAFAAMALLLASVAVYAMFASMVAAQKGELAVRMALGSSRRAIVGLVLRRSASWMIMGFVGGALGVVLVARLCRELLFGLVPFDPLALGGALIALVGCAAVALLIPLRRATHVDPAVALRAQ